jgi:hypothetical protein
MMIDLTVHWLIGGCRRRRRFVLRASRCAATRTVGIAFSVAIAVCASPSTSGSSTLFAATTGIARQRSNSSASRESSFFPVQGPTRGVTKSLPAHQDEKEREEPKDHGVSGPQQHEPVHEDGAASPLATIVCLRSADLEINLVKYAHCHAVSQAASSAPDVDADRDSAPGRGQGGYPPPVGRSPCVIAPSTINGTSTVQ